MKRLIYYKSFSDDVVESRDQEKTLPENYVWIRTGSVWRFWAGIFYLLARMFAFFYCKFLLHTRIVNRQILEQYRDTGYFLYGNHTQPVGDVFLPALLCRSKHPYTIASPSNLGIPVIGLLLPILGILPIPDTMAGMREFLNAIGQRIRENCSVVIYPEAHVWPYYTKIRPFEATSFRFPVITKAPVFCVTQTYQRRRFGKKPAITVYVDGPFFPDENAGKKEKQIQLRDAVFHCMEQRSRESTYTYVLYKEARKG